MITSNDHRTWRGMWSKRRTTLNLIHVYQPATKDRMMQAWRKQRKWNGKVEEASYLENTAPQTRNDVDDDPSLTFLAPFRTEVSTCHLVHCKDTENCHKKVLRCEFRKIVFTTADYVLVRTKGRREYTCHKTGKPKCQYANMYLNFLQKCLTGYDGKFSMKRVIALKETLSKLPQKTIDKLKRLNMQMEEWSLSFFIG